MLINISFVIALSLALCNINANPTEDEIISLPGLSTQVHFKQYSGYLNASDGKFLHYWFVESESSPEKDPLLLWLNGGPGCSSLFGLLGEHGPIHVMKDGKTLYINPFRWNKKANVLYLEAPAGVGFSYSLSGNYTINDDQVAADNYLALGSFFRKFPQFKSNNFYITGESYAGVYVPTLSVKVLTGPENINFKGFAIGNGISDWTLNGNSLIFFGYYHGLFGESMWDNLVQYCCNGKPTRDSCIFSGTKNLNCQNAVSQALALVSSNELNMYNLYADCAQSPSNTSSGKHSRRAHDYQLIPYSFGLTNMLHPDREVIPCVDDSYVANWLNQPLVRQALHIPQNVQNWEECSTDVSANYINIYKTLKPQYETLLSSGKLRALVYNGDVDMACNFLGDQWFVESLNLTTLSSYKEWHYNKQVAGYYKMFQNLTLLTIKGSGHMVPQDKPGAALKMIRSFLDGSI